MKILAFDLGSHMGLAWHDAPVPMTEYLETAEWLLTGARSERLGQLTGRLDCFGKRLGCRPDIVVYERPFARGQHATRSLWGTAGIIEAWAHNIGAAVVDVTPREIKEFATGSGKADKEKMIAAAQTFGYTGANEHEADAVCLLMYAYKHITTESAK